MSQTRASRQHAALLIAGAAAGALVLSGCGKEETGSSSGNTKFVQGTGEVTTVRASDRKAAPGISGKGVDGGELKLSDYRGKVVVLNVWGSWCSPCRAEAPNLAKVARDTKAKGVQFLGINTRDLAKSNAVRFDKRFGITYPSLYDPYGKLILRFPKGSLNPQSLPATLVIDRQGRIAVRALKALSEDELHQIVDPLAAEK
jgi:thiol-disulfide isomerase/thioredoxin